LREDYLYAASNELRGEFPKTLFRARVTEIKDYVAALNVPHLAQPVGDRANDERNCLSWVRSKESDPSGPPLRLPPRSERRGEKAAYYFCDERSSIHRGLTFKRRSSASYAYSGFRVATERLLLGGLGPSS
jgi:hypothetical protein